MAGVHLGHFPTGRLSILAGRGQALDAFHHVLVFEAAHDSPKTILFLDGAHVLNPYDYAEANLQRGFPGDFAENRILTRRAMTPFQWHKMLTRGLEDKLQRIEAGLVVASHFNVQYDKDDLSDWEQEQCIPYALRHLQRMAQQFNVPIIASLDLTRWSHTHPTLAAALQRFRFPTRHVERDPNGWTLRNEGGGILVQPKSRHPTLDAFEVTPIAVSADGRSFNTQAGCS